MICKNCKFFKPYKSGDQVGHGKCSIEPDYYQRPATAPCDHEGRRRWYNIFNIKPRPRPELSYYDADIREILCANSLKDIQAEEDALFIKRVSEITQNSNDL